LIDFEYGGSNYAAYDLANLFCEASIDNNVPGFPGFVVDQTVYPSKERRCDFIRTYLDAVRPGGPRRGREETKKGGGEGAGGGEGGEVGEGGEGGGAGRGVDGGRLLDGIEGFTAVEGEPTKADIDRWDNMVEQFVLASHLYWTLWALGYVEGGRERSGGEERKRGGREERRRDT
jgi:thiamine kinase-like enzyme